MSTSYDFFRTGKQDCSNTFDRETFDFDIASFARTVDHAAQRTGGDPRRLAAKLAEHALRTEAEWPDPEDWIDGTDFDPDEDGPIEKAYAQWKAGYIECAVPSLTDWILDELRERRQ